MKIRGVEIRVVCGDVHQETELLKGLSFLEQEKILRAAYAGVLQKACAKKFTTISLVDLSVAVKNFPKIAVAKIIAQEIYRCLREEKHHLKKIFVILASSREAKFFNKVITSYLNHIVCELCQGPFVTVDTIIEIAGGIVLIERSNPPYGWALPGGFLDYGESLEEGAAREAKEETGLVVKNIKQMHTYSAPGRDPRFQTVTTVFVAQAKGRPRAGSDAQGICVVKPAEWKKMPLAFDHQQVLADYLRWKKR